MLKLLLTLENVWNISHSKESPDIEAKRIRREFERRKLEAERAAKKARAEENEENDYDDQEDNNDPNEPYRYRPGEEESWMNGVLMSDGYTVPSHGGRMAIGPGNRIIGYHHDSIGGFIRDNPFNTKEEAYSFWQQLYQRQIEKYTEMRARDRGAQQ